MSWENSKIFLKRTKHSVVSNITFLYKVGLICLNDNPQGLGRRTEQEQECRKGIVLPTVSVYLFHQNKSH